MSNRRWLDLAEYASLSGSVVGAVASLVSQQAIYASAPLSLCILLNLLNRQKLQRQVDGTILSNLKDLDQRLNQEQQALQGLRRSVLALPTPDDLGLIRESIAQGDRETLAQLTDEVSIAKSQIEKRLLPLEAIDLTPLQQQLSQLDRRQNNLITSVAEVVQALPSLVPKEQADRLAGAISELFEKMTHLEEGLQQLADQPPPDLTPLENQLEQLQQQILNLPPPYNPSILEERVQLLTQEVEKSLQAMANLVSRQDLSAIFTELEKLRQRHQGLSQSFSPVRTTVSDLQQQMKAFSSEFTNRSEPGLIEELRRALAKTARRVMELQEQLRSNVTQEDLTEIRRECQEMTITFTDDLQEQIVSLKQALVSLQTIAHQVEGPSPEIASLRQELLTLEATVTELRVQFNTLQAPDQTSQPFPSAELQMDDSLEGVAEEIQAQIMALTHRIQELECSMEQAALVSVAHPPFEGQPPQVALSHESDVREEIPEEIIACNGLLHEDESPDYVTLSQNLTTIQEGPGIRPALTHEEEVLEAEPEVALGTALVPTQVPLINPHNLLVEALETATDRVIVVSSWLEQCHLNGDLFEQFDLLLSRGVRLEIGWSLSGFLQNSHFFRRINHRWYPEMNQAASLYSVLRHFKQLAKTNPEYCRLYPLAHRDQLLICDRRFAVMIPEAPSETSESYPPLITEDTDTIQEWVQRLEQPALPSTDPEFYFMRAAVRFDLDDIHGVIADYSHGLRFDPMNASAYNNRGLAFYNLGGRERALEDFDQALDLEPTNAIIYFNRAGTRSDLGDRQGALEDYSMAIRLNPIDESAYNNRGLIRSKLGDYIGAQEDYTESIRLDPNNDVAYNNRALIRSKLGDKLGAIEDYTEALRLNPHDDTLYFNRGAVRASLEDYEGSLADYTEALRHNPGFVNAYNNRGFIYQKQGNKQAALADFSRALEINPQFANAYNNRGTVLSKLKDFTRAIADFNQAIQLNPHFANAYNNRGTARSKLKDLAGAIKDFDTAIRLNPEFANAYNNRGLARADLGDREGAIEDLMRAARLFCVQGNESSSQQSLAVLKKLHHEFAETQSVAVS